MVAAVIGAATVEADAVVGCGGAREPLDTVAVWEGGGAAMDIGMFGGSICGGIVEIGTSGAANQKRMLSAIIYHRKEVPRWGEYIGWRCTLCGIRFDGTRPSRIWFISSPEHWRISMYFFLPLKNIYLLFLCVAALNEAASESIWINASPDGWPYIYTR